MGEDARQGRDLRLPLYTGSVRRRIRDERSGVERVVLVEVVREHTVASAK